MLSDCVLRGVQQWYVTTIKDMTRSRASVKRLVGEWLKVQGKPVTLLASVRFLTDFIDYIDTLPISEFTFNLHCRVLGCLVAVQSALSRDGIVGENLPDQVISDTEGFSLATVLSKLSYDNNKVHCALVNNSGTQWHSVALSR